uniref:Plastocyanin-like domain-containing protein n=1 Tax=Caenorhabditis tropicalis TaxID=1561998 RepID=A0A1I7U639_9PELO
MMYDGYENGVLTHNWVGGLGGDGTKYKYSFPLQDPWCSADLHGHIFWVTCTPEEKLSFEYGNKWYLDHPSSKYKWNESQNNVKKNGKFTKQELKEAYRMY